MSDTPTQPQPDQPTAEAVKAALALADKKGKWDTVYCALEPFRQSGDTDAVDTALRVLTAELRRLEASERIAIAERGDALQSLGFAKEEIEQLTAELAACNDLCSIEDGGGKVSEVLARKITALLAENEKLKAETEVYLMRLAACSTVANANTSESAVVARNMHPDYRCAAVDDVARTVDREMALLARLEQAEGLTEYLKIQANSWSKVWEELCTCEDSYKATESGDPCGREHAILIVRHLKARLEQAEGVELPAADKDRAHWKARADAAEARIKQLESDLAVVVGYPSIEARLAESEQRNAWLVEALLSARGGLCAAAIKDGTADMIAAAITAQPATEQGAEVRELVSGLRHLHDVQNGPPLVQYWNEWQAAMDNAAALLAKYEPRTTEGAEKGGR
jgi:hypothetical protein